MNYNITITVQVDTDPTRKTPRRGVTVRVVTDKRTTKEDVIQVLLRNGFDFSKVLEGTQRTYIDWAEHMGGQHFELFINDSVTPPKSVESVREESKAVIDQE